jgi:TFIIF-interacting CTD phosphatase-like protein
MTQKKKLIILDLDATLISAQNIEKFNSLKEKKKTAKFEKTFEMKDFYIVFGRPHLDVFLDFLFKNFSVAVWTAASQMYALAVVENFILTKPSRKLEFLLFDYHNDHSIKKGKGTKDLELLRTFYKIEEFEDMLILDDFEDVLKTNKNKSIRAPFFEYKKRNSHNDSFFLKVIPKLQKFKNKN